MTEFHCLVMVLFSAMFSCFLLDSFELQKMVCLTIHEATFPLLTISRRTKCSGYDEHACCKHIRSAVIGLAHALCRDTWQARRCVVIVLVLRNSGCTTVYDKRKLTVTEAHTITLHMRYDNVLLMLETEEPISKIDCRHFLQEASEL